PRVRSLVTVGLRRLLDEERRRIDPHAAGTAIEPEPQDRLVLGPDIGGVPVEVRLFGREEGQVPVVGQAGRGDGPRPGLATQELAGPARGGLVAAGSAS